MINVQINPLYSSQISTESLEKIAGFSLHHQAVPANVELTIVVDSDERLHELNRGFLGIDAATDVLSFPSDELDPDTGNHYIGDIILSLPRAMAQAQVNGHPLETEVALLVVHGVLHLLGHDHAETAEKATMWQHQKAILQEMGFRLNRWPED